MTESEEKDPSFERSTFHGDVDGRSGGRDSSFSRMRLTEYAAIVPVSYISLETRGHQARTSSSQLGLTGAFAPISG